MFSWPAMVRGRHLGSVLKLVRAARTRVLSSNPLWKSRVEVAAVRIEVRPTRHGQFRILVGALCKLLRPLNRKELDDRWRTRSNASSSSSQRLVKTRKVTDLNDEIDRLFQLKWPRLGTVQKMQPIDFAGYLSQVGPTRGVRWTSAIRSTPRRADRAL